jgi:N6-L-threonylcarbamoyladenine synthase
VLNYINSCEVKKEEINTADIAASFQEAVIDVLVNRTILAAKDYHMKQVAIAGGVAANSSLLEAMEKACREQGLSFYHPSKILCTDNAAMIGAAAYYEYRNGARAGLDLNAVPNLKIGER